MSPRSHRAITSRLSSECDAIVYALDYRLSPESIFPSAIEDALAACLALTGDSSYDSSIEDYVHSPGRRVFVAGDRFATYSNILVLAVVLPFSFSLF